MSFTDEQLRTIESLLEHFVKLIQQKDLLLQRLRNHLCGDSHLVIEAAFQKYVNM